MKKGMSVILLMVLTVSLALPQRSEAHGGCDGWWFFPAFVGGLIFGSAVTAAQRTYVYPPPEPAYLYPPRTVYVYPPEEYPEGDNLPAPPAAQTPISQGSFAMKLVSVLKVGPATTEAQAAEMLATVGISPKDGWFVDQPMTMSVVGDLRSKVGAAAQAGKIPMDKDEAWAAYQSVITDAGFAGGFASPSRHAHISPQPGTSDAGSWVTVPGLWIDRRWVPPHRAWSPWRRQP